MQSLPIVGNSKYSVVLPFTGKHCLYQISLKSFSWFKSFDSRFYACVHVWGGMHTHTIETVSSLAYVSHFVGWK
jgi:hypothetical protein